MGVPDMVISFSNDTAFTQLRDEGFVVTFRPEERERTSRTAAQHTWANRGRGQEKEFDVSVRHLAELTPDGSQFGEFWKMSGFPSPAEWERVVEEMHGEMPESGHFYLVTKGWQE